MDEDKRLVEALMGGIGYGENWVLLWWASKSLIHFSADWLCYAPSLKVGVVV